jgi:hypothetical protein
VTDETTDVDAAWVDFASRLAAAGASITGPEFPRDARMRAEGYRYVTRLTALALQLYLEFGDADRPSFFRYGGNTTPFGATNCDNQYLRAFVDPAGVYRVFGDVGGLQELLFSVQDGEMVLGKTAVLAEVSLGDLEVGDDGSLEMVLGGPERPGNWMPLGDDAVYLNVRQFITDWERDPIATLHIDRIDDAAVAAPATATPVDIAEALDRAATWIEASVPFWNQYSDGMRAGLPVNELSAPNRPVGGAVNMLHGGSRWSLEPQQALVVEFDQVEATYWSIQTYMLGWLQPLDFARRVTSLNDAQVHRDDDGRVRLVLSHEDPGVQNWLDTTGLPDGLVSYRWINPAREVVPTSTVVPVATLRDHLPTYTPVFTADDRRAQIASRVRGIDRRFHR